MPVSKSAPTGDCIPARNVSCGGIGCAEMFGKGLQTRGMHGLELNAGEAETVAMMIALASSAIDEATFAHWLRENV